MFSIKILKSKKFPEIKIIKPSLNKDHRGLIYSVFENANVHKILPKKKKFKHLKITKRKKNTLVGIHLDNKTWKLFGCISGKIHHNVCCLNVENANYLKNISFILSDKIPQFVLIPPGFGNSFYCYKDSIIIYCLSYDGKYFDVKDQSTILWNDKNLDINWPCKRPHLSFRDKYAKPFIKIRSKIR